MASCFRFSQEKPCGLTNKDLACECRGPLRSGNHYRRTSIEEQKTKTWETQVAYLFVLLFFVAVWWHGCCCFFSILPVTNDFVLLISCLSAKGWDIV